MRKKSHILLARYIADHMSSVDELQDHRKAFCLGNVLPDIKPSFLTESHEFDGTFETVKGKMRDLTVDCDTANLNQRIYWRRLGEVIHYVADYFTFPHNDTFEGTLVAHGQYEKALKCRMKTYIKSGRAKIHAADTVYFEDLHDLVVFIRSKHKEYLSKERCVSDDIEFIITVCYQAAQGLFRLLEDKCAIENTQLAV